MPGGGAMIDPSIQQDLLDAIVAALREIRPGGGYQSTLAPTRLKPGVGEQIADGKVVVYIPSQSLTNQGPQETQQDTLWHLDVAVEIVAVAQDENEPVDRRAWIMWADVYKRLCGPDANIAHVQYIWPSQATFEPDPSAAIGFLEAVFTVQYQHAAGNPYST